MYLGVPVLEEESSSSQVNLHRKISVVFGGEMPKLSKVGVRKDISFSIEVEFSLSEYDARGLKKSVVNGGEGNGGVVGRGDIFKEENERSK